MSSLEEQCSFSERNSVCQVSEAHPIRCVDIIYNRLVNISPGDRYACLSYIWCDLDLAARRPSFVTETRVNLGALPQTIQDAITVIHELGETCLWTDII